MAFNILLVDDHPLFRKGLRHLLEEHDDFRVTGEVDDGQSAIEETRRLSPDVVIMDISMPNIDGIEATRRILSESPQVKVVALSMHSGKRFVENMLQAGAVGYILKKSIPEDLVNCLRMVLQGDIYLSPSITGIVVSEYKDLLARISPSPQPAAPLPLLKAKLQRPNLSTDLLPRSDLAERLSEMQKRPLTLVSAAAGYGKSTMASLWLNAWDGPYGWLTLDDEDNNILFFLSYLLDAVQKGTSKKCESLRSLLGGTKLPPVSTLSKHLINDLDELEEPFILVLDDYHKIRDKKVHSFIDEILKHPPEKLHLILLTRRDPPLLISLLRSRGQVNEIRTSDLAFDIEETAVFLHKSLGQAIDQDKAAIVQEKLEGWPAGMRMICGSHKRLSDMDRFLTSVKGSFPVIMDYLMTEVLANETPEMAQMMSATSLLEFFCAPLCDALHANDDRNGVTGITGDEFLAKLQLDNMFLIPLDEENRWFRYHPIFQQLLRDQVQKSLSPELIEALRKRAESWFFENDLNLDGGKPFSPDFTPEEIKTMPNAAKEKIQARDPHILHPQIDPLTNRELDILELLAQRQSNSEIAESLFISVTTVKAHLRSIYSKLDVHKRRQAVEKAKALGIL